MANTGDMIFRVPFVVSYMSALTRSNQANVILTVRPLASVTHVPPVFMQPGDSVTIAMRGLGQTEPIPVIAEE